MTVDERIEQAELSYHHSVFGGDSSQLASADLGLDAVEADLALARGRLLHARFLDERAEDTRELELFERAADLYAQLGDVRGEGEARFWIGAYHQVVRDDTPTALPAFHRALDLATRAEDPLTRSYVLRHLGFAAHQDGRLDEARDRLEESTRLRRELAFHPGTAANLIGLAHLAAQQDRRDDAAAHLAEATHLAETSDAKGVLHWITDARAELDLP
ncbi:tetratricopeptide repeat protein [Kitasatospora cinereorecta]|uniref:Tetratricopeptide repeat protein n=1 Tax=Kitasatospora cinereorecta TaxID=285560 RepID=A0ABW0VIU9_9ACTN